MNDYNHHDTQVLSPANTFPSTLIPFKRKRSPVIARSSDDISCICGFSYDDGFSIACDDCSRWCHAACFDIMEGEVPEEFRCWECVPRPVDKERAMRLQRAKLGQVSEQAAAAELDRTKRRASPCIERKPRRASTAAATTPPVVVVSAMDQPKRRRRPSVHDETPSLAAIDVDEPLSLSYVHIPRDIIPNDDTRERLRRQAHHWRGITALDDQPSRTSLRPLPSSSFSNPALSICTNPSVRPPSYAVHAATSIPSEHLIAPYKSTITPSSSYLSDPLNSYAHSGMPKPFVHLFGHPLDLALDSRITGNSARFVRSGCRPNAVLRPYLCLGDNKPPETLSFGIFALRDLKANEEVILGWEWDDGHVVHNLPALIASPHAFPGASPCDTQSPEKLHHIRNQMSNIMHALSSTFTTCACGARAKNCAITQMAAFVDGEIAQSVGQQLDLGPLVGGRRGFRTREREPFSGGLKGVELCDESNGTNNLSVPHLVLSPASDDDQNTLKAQGNEEPPPPPPPTNCHTQSVQHLSKDPATGTRRSPSPTCHEPLSPAEPVPMLVDQVPCEDKMPPKMRKKWIQREANARSSECQSEEKGVVEMTMDVGPHSMPPPPIPSAVLSGTSPSTSFAQLSLVSPIIPSAPHPLVSFSSLDTVLTSLNQASRSPVHESESTMACADPVHSELPPTSEGDVSIEPPSEPLPEMQSAIPLEETAPDDSPTTMDVPPLPALEEEAKEETTSLLPENQTPYDPGTSPTSPTAAEMPLQPASIELYDPGTSPTSPTAAEMPLLSTQKKKMSLKDFAIRKRKQREEEERARNNAIASGLVPSRPNGENMDPDPNHSHGVVVDEEREGPEVQSETKVEEEEEGHEAATAPVMLSLSSSPSLPVTTLTREAKQELLESPQVRFTHSDEDVEISDGNNYYALSSQSPKRAAEEPPPPPPSQPSQLSQPHPTTLPRSHTPPTQPWSFNASSPHTRSPSPSHYSISRRPSLPPYRSILPPCSSSTIPPTSPAAGGGVAQAAPSSSSGRPLPSGPRALRTVNVPLNHSYRTYSGSQYVPRGPSADRERMEWERERTWQRTRVRGPGWGR